MKFFICFAIIIAAAAASPAILNNPSGASANPNPEEASESEPQPLQPVNAPLDLTRLRKSAYGGGSAGGYGGGASASMPAPPCPKNYIFSCQPNLSPIACAAPSSSYGSQGGYSAPVPTYVAPLPNSGYGVPQAFAYTNQYYQY